MLYKITLLTSLLFSVLYPLCFFISFQDPLKNRFHHFHLGLPVFIGGVLTFGIFLSSLSQDIKLWVTFFEVILLSSCLFSWKKESPNVFFLLWPVAIGLISFIKLEGELIAPNVLIHTISILGGLVLVASNFAMNLGHFYLNVHGLPVSHLKRSVYVFFAFICARILWDCFYILKGQIFYNGDFMPLWQFITTMDGFLLIVALLFGGIFPFVALLMVFEILRLKNTQSATGILYVILCAIFLSDLTYKYYLIKFGIPL
jgi:hypothetical protein